MLPHAGGPTTEGRRARGAGADRAGARGRARQRGAARLRALGNRRTHAGFAISGSPRRTSTAPSDPRHAEPVLEIRAPVDAGRGVRALLDAAWRGDARPPPDANENPIKKHPGRPPMSKASHHPPRLLKAGAATRPRGPSSGAKASPGPRHRARAATIKLGYVSPADRPPRRLRRGRRLHPRRLPAGHRRARRDLRGDRLKDSHRTPTGRPEGSPALS